MSSSHTIRLTTRDGEVLTFACDDGQDVVSAAAAADMILPAQCRNGTCGNCLGTCKSGTYEHGPHTDEALSQGDRAAGAILMCRTFAHGDLDIAVPFDRALIGTGQIPERLAEILSIEDIGGNSVRLLLRYSPDINGSRACAFEAGQYMDLTPPGRDLSRAYSLSNLGNWGGELEFLIRLIPGGQFSEWLRTKAKPGIQLQVRGPQGGFTLANHGTSVPRWFVAGGTGLAPLLSMLRRMADWGETNPCRLYVGVSREEELFGEDIIARIQALLPHLAVERCVWKPSEGWTGFAGTPVDAMIRDLDALGVSPDIYVCGPPALVAATEAAARSHGIPAEQVFVERFG